MVQKVKRLGFHIQYLLGTTHWALHSSKAPMPKSEPLFTSCRLTAELSCAYPAHLLRKKPSQSGVSKHAPSITHSACLQLEGQAARKTFYWDQLLMRLQQPPTDESEKLAFKTT